MRLIARYHRLSFIDAFHISHEMTYHSVSIFIDVLYRYYKIGHDNFTPNSLALQNFEKELKTFFSTNTSEASIGSSSILRFNLMKLISLSQGRRFRFYFKNNNEPIESSLTDLRKYTAKEERYWNILYIFSRIPQTLIDLFQAIKGRIYFTGRRYKIGYVYMEKKYYYQLSNFHFRKIDVPNFNTHLDISINDRKKYFKRMFSQFYEEINSFDEWSLFKGISVNEELIKVLFSIISLRLEPMIIKKSSFLNKIENIKTYLKTKEFDALFSVGNWFRIDNALIAVAARKLKLPVIEFQNGGGNLYVTRTGLTRDIRNIVDYYFSWGDWKSFQSMDNSNIIKIPDVRLLRLYDRGNKSLSKRKEKNQKNSILFTPVGFSDPFILEMYNHYDENMLKGHRKKTEKIFNNLDKTDLANRTRLCVKIKASGSKMYTGHEYMLYPEIRLKNIDVSYLFNGPCYRYFDKMDISLTDGMSTTFAQSMSYNIPTICFWNSEMIRIKPIYKDFVSKMLEIGILVTNEDQAFSTINKLYEDPKWWFSPNVQKYREEFIDLFAYYKKNWIAELNNGFMSALNSSK